MRIPGEHKQHGQSSKPATSAPTERDRDWGGKGELFPGIWVSYPVLKIYIQLIGGITSSANLLADQTWLDLS